MTTQTIETRIKLLNSTLAVIEAVNPVLLPGEKWLERHATTGAITGRSKTGLDGVVQPNDSITGTPFNSLPFDPLPTAAQIGADAAGTAVAAIEAHVAAADSHPGYTTPQEAAAAAPVQSVVLSPPNGWGTQVASTGGNITLTLTLPTGYSLPNNASQGQWDTAYSVRQQWSGGATGLNAATGRASLGLGSAALASAGDFASSAQGALAATAVQPAALTAGLAGKADLTGPGGTVPSSQLPGFVDDVLEFANFVAFPATGETGKLYISLATNRQYRWSGSVYVEIVASPGSTDAVAEGSVNLYFTTARGEAAAASWWAASASKTKLDGLATVATSGLYGDLGNLPTLPNGALVGTTDAQILSNKTLGSIDEAEFTITDVAGFAIDPNNGPLQTVTLQANRAPTVANFGSGQSVKVKIATSGFAVTWTSVAPVWISATAGVAAPTPTLGATGFNHVQFWKEGSVIYAQFGWTAT